MLFKWLTEASKRRGSAKALVYRDTYLSWRGLEHRVDRRVQEFKSMSIGKGHWVGLMLGNVPDFAILALALSKLGSTVVPIDPTTGARDLSLILECAPLRALITRPRGGLDGGPTPSVDAKPIRPGDAPESRRRLQGTLLTCSIYKAPPKNAGEAAVVLFTSDSAGDPKGVLRTGENLEAGAQLIAKALDVTEEDRILTTVPLYHSYGFDFGLALALRFGATLYLEDEVAPKRVVKLLKDQEINLLPGTPSLYAGLAKLPTAKALKIKGARYLSAGAALPEATAEAFKNRWGIRVLPVYHTTETGMLACDKKGGTPDTVGKALDGVEIRVGEGKTAAGTEGAVWVKSKAMAKSSVGSMPKKGGEILVGGIDAKGWLRTGDVGHLDKTGKLFLSGREDGLVKLEGKRVALNEVEGCIEELPRVQRARAQVITDPLGGPMVIASVIVDGKIAAQDIIDHCAKNLAPYKVPRRIEFCDEFPT